MSYSRFQPYILDPNNITALTVGDLSPKEQASLEMQLDHQEYFASLATTLHFIQEQSSDPEDQLLQDSLSQMIDELNYLQNHYQIVKKDKQYRP